MKELGFFPNWSFQHPRSLELAQKLAEIAPGDLSSTFFVSSGSEAVETVIKLARQYHYSMGEGQRHKVISRKIAYHGTTMGALSVTGIPYFKAPFEPLLQGFMHANNTQQDPEGAADAIEEAIEFGPPETVAAVILEPVQNAGGCLVPPRLLEAGARDLRPPRCAACLGRRYLRFRAAGRVVRHRAFRCGPGHEHLRQGRYQRLLADGRRNRQREGERRAAQWRPYLRARLELWRAVCQLAPDVHARLDLRRAPRLKRRSDGEHKDHRA